MEPLDLSNEILLEDILDTNEYVYSEKRNLIKAVIEHFPPHSVIYFLEFVENSTYENKYYGYIFNKTLNCNMKLNSIQIYNFINFFKKNIQRGSII